MTEYIITDKLRVRWEKHLLVVVREGGAGQTSVVMDHDEAKKLAAFIMAQRDYEEVG